MRQLPLFKPTMAESMKVEYRKRLKRNRNSSRAFEAPSLWSETDRHNKEMVLFFLDIRNFTPFVEAKQAEEVIYVVRKLFSNFQTIIKAHHGEIIETTGDGFYAAFGFKNSIRESVDDAVKTGYSILETLENLNAGLFRQKFDHQFEIGMGIHAGKVASGTILLGNVDHKIVMGYPVNIASRLEAATKELNNNFIVSSKVYDLLASPPMDKPMTEINLKGIDGPVRIHLMGRPYGEN